MISRPTRQTSEGCKIVTHTTNEAFRILRALFPPKALLLVGGGTGSRLSTFDDWGHFPITVVEADPELSAQLEKRFQDKANIRIQNAIAGPTTGRTAFHVTTPPLESSLLNVEHLLPVWPNLTLNRTMESHATALSTLLSPETDIANVEHPNWIWVDCFPASEILEGAQQHFETWDVICGRVILDPTAVANTGTLQHLDRLLDSKGFTHIHTIKEANQRVGTAIYAQDWKSAASCKSAELREKLSQQKRNLSDQIARLSGQADQATESLNELGRQHADEIARLQSKHGTALTTLEANNAAFTSRTETQIEALVSERDAAQAEVARLTEALSQAQEINNGFKMVFTKLDMIKHELAQANHRQSASREQPSPQTEDEGYRAYATSQLGQDIWVIERCKLKRGGFFVEVGAADGILLSNTWLLERHFGWRGICVEPNPKFFTQREQNRQCTVTNDCVGEVTGQSVDFIMADEFGCIDSYANNDSHAPTRQAFKDAGQIIPLQTISLADLLTRNNAPREIDYLSIDTEGSELDILKVFPFDNWKIRLITVEHNFTSARSSINQLLVSAGYSRLEKSEDDWDDWYWHNTHMSDPRSD